jgi:hypothetical protein
MSNISHVFRSNDTVRIWPFTGTLRRINGPCTAVISGAEIRPYHSEITAVYSENTDSRID